LSNRTIEQESNQPKIFMPPTSPVLVFLHYFGGAARSWQWVTERLPDYRCVALDLPGFGGTPALSAPSIEAMADYVQQETERLGLTAFTLLGHSMGGKIALQVAANDALRDQRVRQLILIAPSPPTVERMPNDEKERMLRHPDRDEAEITVANGTYRPLPAEPYALAVATQLEADEATWRWWLRQGMNHSIANRVEKVSVPITVLASDDDPVIDPETIRQEVMGVLPSAQLISTQEVGHLLPLEDPEWVANQIRRVC
jgi:pimeloyl-ACP methyl ester carboxylesterase